MPSDALMCPPKYLLELCDAIKSAWAKIAVEGFQNVVESVLQGIQGCLGGKKQPHLKNGKA